MSDALVVVGAGPAGIHAAILARRAGLAVRLLEAGGEPGGQLRRTWSRLTSVPEHAGPGVDYAGVLAQRLAAADVTPENVEATGLARRGPSFEIALAAGVAIGARAVIVATGLRPRALGVPGERELRDRGVSPSATRDRAKFSGRPVVVVGGGDAAYENALLLAAAGAIVTLAVRGRPRARDEFRKRVASERKITVLEGARVTAIRGDREVEGVELATPDGARALEAAGVFVKVGAVPNSEWCRKALDCDGEGFVKADLSRATSWKGVWAAGDVTRPERFTVRSAMADAAIAVQFARKFLGV